MVNWVCGTEKGKPVGSKGNKRVSRPLGFRAPGMPNMRHEANFAPAEHHVAIHI